MKSWETQPLPRAKQAHNLTHVATLVSNVMDATQILLFLKNKLFLKMLLNYFDVSILKINCF